MLNIRDRGLKDITNPDTIKAYLEWSEIEKNGLHLEADELISYAEQVVYRRSKCAACVKNGECVIVKCHCPADELMPTPLAKCKAGFFGQMLPPDEWKQFKEENNIELIAVGG